MSKKLPVHRDAKMESLAEIAFDACAAYIGEDGQVKIIGEVVSSTGGPIEEYREVQAIVYDADGDILGRSYTNWSEFQLRQSFEIDLEGLPGEPSRVKVFPSKG